MESELQGSFIQLNPGDTEIVLVFVLDYPQRDVVSSLLQSAKITSYQLISM